MEIDFPDHRETSFYDTCRRFDILDVEYGIYPEREREREIERERERERATLVMKGHIINDDSQTYLRPSISSRQTILPDAWIDTI